MFSISNSSLLGSHIPSVISKEHESTSNKPEVEYRESLSQHATEFQNLRAKDKGSLFSQLNGFATAALKNCESIEKDAEEFFSITREIATLERLALCCVEEYESCFEEFVNAHCNQEQARESIPWLAEGQKPVSSEEDRNKIKRLINMEKAAKGTQLQVYHQSDIQNSHLSAHEKIIVGRAIQRFLNATTLILDSSLGTSAFINLKETAALVGVDIKLPDPLATWTPQSLRNHLSSHLIELHKQILTSPSSSTLSHDAMEMLKDKCAEVVKIVDSYGVFNVPNELKKAGSISVGYDIHSCSV